MAMASALRDVPLRGDCCYLGEIGLAGEVRPVTRLAARLKEAARLGLKRAVVSGKEREETFRGIEVRRVENLSEALKEGFAK